MIKTIVTIKFTTTKEQFESNDFQGFLKMINSGEAQRELKKDRQIHDLIISYWTDYKTKQK